MGGDILSLHKKTVFNRISYFLLSAVLIIAIIAGCFISDLSGNISEIMICECRNFAIDSIGGAVDKQVKECKNNDYINISRDSIGNIISVQSNSQEINKINSEISDEVNSNLEKKQNIKIKVPVGTISGISYFSGNGFNVPLSVHQTSCVKTNMESEFVDAGINQTKYRLTLEITVEMEIITPEGTKKITVNDTYLINETLIVGKIPETYLSKK